MKIKSELEALLSNNMFYVWPFQFDDNTKLCSHASMGAIASWSPVTGSIIEVLLLKNCLKLRTTSSPWFHATRPQGAVRAQVKIATPLDKGDFEVTKTGTCTKTEYTRKLVRKKDALDNHPDLSCVMSPHTEPLQHGPTTNWQQEAFNKVRHLPFSGLRANLYSTVNG